MNDIIWKQQREKYLRATKYLRAIGPSPITGDLLGDLLHTAGYYDEPEPEPEGDAPLADLIWME